MIDIQWGKYRSGKIWHAFVFFDGYDTTGGVCSPCAKSIPENLVDAPPTQGMDRICRDCSLGVMGMKKRYHKLKSTKETLDMLRAARQSEAGEDDAQTQGGGG